MVIKTVFRAKSEKTRFIIGQISYYCANKVPSLTILVVPSGTKSLNKKAALLIINRTCASV